MRVKNFLLLLLYVGVFATLVVIPSAISLTSLSKAAYIATIVPLAIGLGFAAEYIVYRYARLELKE